jgi:hypothetical protein
MEIVRLFADAFASPARALAAAAERRSVLPAILAATVASVLLALAIVPRLDFERAALDKIESQPDAADVTPHQKEEQLASARKLGALSVYAGAALGPAAVAFAAALLLWMGFRVAGASPGFRPTLAVSSWALLPKALESLLLLPAALRAPSMAPETVARLAPWSAAYLLGGEAGPPVASLAASLNLFSLWSAALLAVGMTRVAGTSGARATAVVIALWAGLVASGMALASLTASSGVSVA